MNNYMQEALRLAEQGRNTVAPNPMVGCVIECNGKVIGRGWHKKAGSLHAEIAALQEAGNRACGANVYVTLEPCCHYGRTPPCVDSLIQAQVKAVHIPFCDPNPLVKGEGVKKLKEAGIKVYIGEEEKAARKQNEVFLHYIATKQPFVIAKWAMSLDGRIATDCGHSKWITGEKARQHVHQTRNQVDAVLVGLNTVMIDDPQLTVRNLKGEGICQPLRVVLDSSGKIPAASKVISSDLPGKTLIATIDSRFRGNDKQEVLVLPEDKYGKVDINALLNELGKREITSLLIEGGREIFTSFVREGLVNKIHGYIAPKLIGGKNVTTPLADLGISHMVNATQLVYEKHEVFGDDLFVEARLIRRNKCSQE